MAFEGAIARVNWLPSDREIGDNAEPVAAENPENFNKLLRRFQTPLLQYATRLIGDRERARDVVQETFAQLQRSAGTQPERVPAKWLFAVCRNRALNVCRKERRMAYLSEEALDRCADEGLSPLEKVEEGEARGFLLQIVGTLPVRQQEVVQLKFQDLLSYQEISEITGLSVSNVGFLIHTALRTLRKRFAEEARDFIPFAK